MESLFFKLYCNEVKFYANDIITVFHFRGLRTRTLTLFENNRNWTAIITKKDCGPRIYNLFYYKYHNPFVLDYLRQFYFSIT